MKRPWIVLSVLLLGGTIQAQESASYRLTEFVFGGPAEVVPSSVSFQITLSGLGVNAAGVTLDSSSFSMSAGFLSTYPPPAEVSGLTFTDSQSLQWNPETSVGVYNLYRGLVSDISGLGFGMCEQQNLVDPMATDNDPVPAGDAHYYLVTAENRLNEEGTKGILSNGTERANSVPCP